MYLVTTYSVHVSWLAQQVNLHFFCIAEPDAEKDVFTDSSDGSDEIIDLSSLSDSDTEDLVQNEEPSQVSTNEEFTVKWTNWNNNNNI